HHPNGSKAELRCTRTSLQLQRPNGILRLVNQESNDRVDCLTAVRDRKQGQMSYYDALLSEIPNDFQQVIIGLDSGVLKIENITDTTLTNCILDEPADTHEMEPADGQVIQQDTLKIWPSSQSVKPPLGSVLVDSDGLYWTIIAVRYKSIVKTW